MNPHRRAFLACCLVLALAHAGQVVLAQQDTGRAGGGAGAADGARGGRGATGQRGGGNQGAGPLGGRGFARGRGDAPAGTGVIRGRVTAQDTGAPVRRAQVRATTSGGPFGRLAATDANGEFELRDLPAGAWALTASKPGFVSQRLGQKRAFETVSPIALAEGQQTAGANFALIRGGAITGRLLDDFGDPAANARVQVLRSQMSEGRRRLTPVGVGDETDDTGAFRLSGLAPGDYYVAATLRASPQDASQDRAGYAPTYFPGTGSAGEAQRITVGLGQEMPVSFSLQPVRTVRISGTVISAGGAPPTNGVVALLSADGDSMGVIQPTGGQIQADGAFVISNAVPGSYILGVRTGTARGIQSRNGVNGEAGTLALVVGTDDITGVTITTTRGATLEGTVVSETGARPALNGVRVTARPLGTASALLGARAAPAAVTAEGTFSLSSLMGAVSLRVEGLPQQWTVKSINVGGLDATDSPLDFKGTEQVTGARIVVTDKVTEVNGSVKLGTAPATEYAVVVFAEDEARWTFPTRFVRTVRGNAQGSFSVRGLPAGASYLAAALTYVDDGEAQDPAFLSSLKEHATSVSLREGDTKSLELRVIER